jgi:hypothetical protein
VGHVHSPSLDSVEAGAPEVEIEITPEMIEAGTGELYQDWGETKEEWATRIFRVMMLAKK